MGKHRLQIEPIEDRVPNESLAFYCANSGCRSYAVLTRDKLKRLQAGNQLATSPDNRVAVDRWLNCFGG